MTGTPAVTPVTTPDTEPTVASATLLLLHEPPDVLFARAVVSPTHTLSVPVIGTGIGLTVIEVVA